MKRTLFAILFVLAVCANASARQAGVARKIDEFGEIEWSDLMARLDNFAIELQNEPNSKGVVVFYSAKHKFPGWTRRRADASLDYLVKTRGLDAARLSVMNGGLRDETTSELWVVPAGAGLSLKPFDVSLLMSGEKTPLPFDRFVIIERGDHLVAEYYFATPYVNDPDLYAYFAEVLRSDPALRGCVIGYTSRRGSPAAARRIASRAKLTIAKSHAIDVGRVVALGGGRRDYKMVELWLAPPGAELPKPTPDARRTTRGKTKRR